MRRDKDDIRWQEVKERVTKRDHKTCRFIKICSAKDAMMLKKMAPSALLNRLDHAHVFPVSSCPHMVYDDSNIVLLNRWTHHNLDECKNPITGLPITREERDRWWRQIIGDAIYEELLEKAGKEL